MSKSYQRLLQKLDNSNNNNPSQSAIDPQIAALQARFSSIVESSKKDILGHDDNNDDEGEGDDDNDEDMGDFDEDDDHGFDHGEGEFDDDYGEMDDLMNFGEGEQNDDELISMMNNKGLQKSKKFKDGEFEGVDEEEQDEEDDELNIFQYDWDIERDESDSELDGNDDEDDEAAVADDDDDDTLADGAQGPVLKKTKPNNTNNNNNKKNNDNGKGKNNTKGKDENEINSSQSLYDQYFNTSLSQYQIHMLEAQSAFIPPQSDQIGLTLREDVSESDLIKQLRYNNKYNPYGRLNISNSMLGKDNNNDDGNNNGDEPEIIPRTSTRLDNIVLRCGTFLDRYNFERVKNDYPNVDEDEYNDIIEYDLNQLTSNQIAAQQLQISSDRQTLGLSPLPQFPPSDSKYPVDQYGDGLIVTPGKQRIKIQKMEDNDTWRKTGYKKSQLQKIKSDSDIIPKMAIKRPTPSFKSLGLKQRLAEHLTTSGLVTPTAYNLLRNSYITYSSDQTPYQFVTNRINDMETKHITALSKDHGLLLPSYQHDVQTIFASLLSTYVDCFIAPPIPPPNQQIDWFLYRDVYLIHIINHILLHRDRIIAHNEAIYRRDARSKENNFIRELSRITNQNERFQKLEQHLDTLSKIIDDETKSPQEQQDAQARLAVLTHSNKTRLHIKRLQEQYEKEELLAATAAAAATTTNTQGKNPPLIKSNKKLTAKQQERLAIEQRQIADLEFQQQMSSLKLSKAQAQVRQLRSLNNNDNDTTTTTSNKNILNTTSSMDKYRDQGFTRPTILIIAPSKLHAYFIISRMIQLLPPQQTKRIQNMDRFNEDFGDSSGEHTATNNKPLDYNLNFNGNNDDSFFLGLQLNGNGLKLYSSLYSSDIVIASPLGLKLVVGNEGMKPHERKADFLSSIEISVIDQLQLISHQNMDHLTDVLQVINGFPSKTNNIDFARIKEGFLNGHGRFYRQNIWLSGMLTPHLQFLYQRYCENKNGSLRLRPYEYSNLSPYFKLPQGVLKQTFYRIDLNANIKQMNTMVKKNVQETIFDKKLHIWFNDVWPRIKDWYQTEGNTVIFIPSSYDFVRIRNLMEEKFIDYCTCSEYTDQRLVDSYRSRIHRGTAKFILVSERFWVFNRSSFYGIKHIVWYGLPTMPQVYIDFINSIKLSTNNTTTTNIHTNGTNTNNNTQSVQSSSVKNLAAGNTSSLIKHMSSSIIAAKQPTSFVLYSLQDAMALERIIGTEFAKELLTSGENIHVIS